MAAIESHAFLDERARQAFTCIVIVVCIVVSAYRWYVAEDIGRVGSQAGAGERIRRRAKSAGRIVLG